MAASTHVGRRARDAGRSAASRKLAARAHTERALYTSRAAAACRRDLPEDEQVMLDALMTGKIAALVLDTNFVMYTSGSNVSGAEEFK